MTILEQEVKMVEDLAKRYFPLPDKTKLFVMAYLFGLNRARISMPFGDATYPNRFFRDLEKAMDENK